MLVSGRGKHPRVSWGVRPAYWRFVVSFHRSCWPGCPHCHPCLRPIITPLAQPGPASFPDLPVARLHGDEFLGTVPSTTTWTSQGQPSSSTSMMMHLSLRLVVLLEPQKGSRYKCPPDAPYLTEVYPSPSPPLGFCLEKVFQCGIPSIRHSLSLLSYFFLSPSFPCGLTSCWVWKWFLFLIYLCQLYCAWSNLYIQNPPNSWIQETPLSLCQLASCCWKSGF